MLLIAEALGRLGTEVGLLRKRRLLMLVPVCGMEPPLRGLICGCLLSSALYGELKTEDKMLISRFPSHSSTL